MLAVVLFAARAMPTAAGAQHWSAEEQEIIDLNQSCMDAWAAEDIDAMRATCNEHPDGRFWWMAEDVPSIGWFEKNIERWGEATFPRDQWIYWEARPISVRIFADTALIHFWMLETHANERGETETRTRKHLNIWQQIDGRWTWIGGMGGPSGDPAWITG
jgi:hypothetical protein